MDEKEQKLKFVTAALDTVLRRMFGEICPFALVVMTDGSASLDVLGNLDMEAAFALLDVARECQTQQLRGPQAGDALH